MINLDALRDRFPDVARDIKINLSSVLGAGVLSEAQRWGVAVAAAANSKQPELLAAVIKDAHPVVGDAVIEDALAAAALMAMNNVFYRFRHLVAKPAYADKPARLRMQRIAKPATTKADFELFCLAVSAINGCELCVQSHEAVVLEGGLTEEHVHDAVRVAATFQAAAVSLTLPQPPYV